MSLINIRRDVQDQFYRYKMERLQAKIEGKGNGIKTVVANLSSIAASLERPPNYVIKYFGFELGAQTNIDPKDDRWIVNGAHDASKLQDYLDGFINKFVLCKQCKNPETVLSVKDARILLDCKACGVITEVDPRLKLVSFILKNVPKKGKKDKSTKKADRKARKEAEANGEDGDGKSPGDSGSDNGDQNGDAVDGASDDDALTRKINEEASELPAAPAKEEKEFQWSVDMSEEAVKARAKVLPDDFQSTLNLGDGDDDGDASGNTAYDQLGEWIMDEAKEKGGVTKVDDIEIYKKAKELGIENKHRTMTVLAQCIFDENIVKQIEKRAGMLKKMMMGGKSSSSEKHEKAFLGGLERFIGIEHPTLIPQVSAVLLQVYTGDLITEEVIRQWASKASKKYVDLETSRKVRKSADKFVEWLENAESESDDDE